MLWMNLIYPLMILRSKKKGTYNAGGMLIFLNYREARGPDNRRSGRAIAPLPGLVELVLPGKASRLSLPWPGRGILMGG
jgi:hypothetical protein